MRTFLEFMEDAWGDERLITQIESKMLDLGKDVELFNSTLTHGDHAVRLAMDHFTRSFQILITTYRTSVRKNISNPERADHAPVSIDVS